jgi:dTDP-glucose pyrophosphorylase
MKELNKYAIQEINFVGDALKSLQQNSPITTLFVLDKQKKLLGSITDGDIRAALINGTKLSDPVSTVMNKKPKFFRENENNFKKFRDFRDQNIKHVPVVNKKLQIINIIDINSFEDFIPVEAIIMAGGLGKRLSPLTLETPKPLLKIDDKPIISHVIDQLKLYGISKVTISLNHMADKIKSEIGKGDQMQKIKYVQEERKLGTAGALSLIDDFSNENLILTNSDILSNINYSKFFEYHINSNSDITVGVVPYYVNIPYGILEIDKNDKVENLIEKPSYKYFSNAGIYMIKRDLVEIVPKNKFFDATDIIKYCINSSNLSVSKFEINDYWKDIGNINDYEQAKIDVKRIFKK